MKLSRNKILITGATSGIGLEMAKRYHALGNRIVAVGRNQEKLAAMEGEMEDLVGIVCDVSDSEQLALLVERIRWEHSDVNVLINNAGIQKQLDLVNGEVNTEDIAQEIAVNLQSLIVLTKEVLPLLRTHQNAAVVNVSSGLAFAPKKSAPVYCATKAGVHAFTQALRYQLEETDVRVFEVIPPMVDTPMTEGRNPSGKITARELVDEFIQAFRKDRFEINIGKVKAFRWLLRLWPQKAYGLLKHA